MNIKVLSKSKDQTEIIASKIGSILENGDLILLSGELGSGKTVFVKGIGKALSKNRDDPVISPTFTLIQEYDLKKKIYHIDLYRIDTTYELEELGIHEFCNKEGITIIEWADKFPDNFSESKYIEIKLAMISENTRDIHIDFSKDFDQKRANDILSSMKSLFFSR